MAHHLTTYLIHRIDWKKYYVCFLFKGQQQFAHIKNRKEFLRLKKAGMPTEIWIDGNTYDNKRSTIKQQVVENERSNISEPIN